MTRCLDHQTFVVAEIPEEGHAWEAGTCFARSRWLMLRTRHGTRVQASSRSLQNQEVYPTDSLVSAAVRYNVAADSVILA